MWIRNDDFQTYSAILVRFMIGAGGAASSNIGINFMDCKLCYYNYNKCHLFYLFILKKTLMSDYGLNISDMYERQHVDHVLCEIKFGIYLKLFNVLNCPIGWPAWEL